MGYVLEKMGDNYFAITNANSNCGVGYVYRRGGSYEIRDDNSEVIAFVSSLEEAIPALVAHTDNNPPQWECESATRFQKIQSMECCGSRWSGRNCGSRFVMTVY
jgi:hypothetical protein